MADFAFDEDSRVVAAGSEGAFTAALTGRWNGTAGAVNGGYMLAICTRALALGMPFPDPVVVSGFFLRPGTAGPAADRVPVRRTTRLVHRPPVGPPGQRVLDAVRRRPPGSWP